MPLATGILSKKQVKNIDNHIKSSDFCGNDSCKIELVPSNAFSEPTFDHDQYWRGSI